jgi:hypothetical protein
MGAEAPRPFRSLLKVKRSPQGTLWMLRNEIRENDMMRGAWMMLLSGSLFSAILVIGMALVLGSVYFLYCLPFLFLAPIIAASLFMNRPDVYAMEEERQMLREAPSVIGSMTMSMQLTPSLEEAVAFSSEKGQGVLSQRFRQARWTNITRSNGDLSGSLEEVGSSLAMTNDALKQAIHLVISSTCERTKEGMDRLLDKANSVTLVGVRDAVDSFVTFLSVPTMVLFSLGTLMPIMMFSILPLLSLGTSFTGSGDTTLSLGYLAFFLLILVPVLSLTYSWKTLSKNPLGMVRGSESVNGLISLPFIGGWIATILAVSVVRWGDFSSYLISGAILLPPCFYFILKSKGKINDEKKRHRLEKECTAALFQIGNRMLSGATFDAALRDVAVGVGGEFSSIANGFLQRSRMTGESYDTIILKVGTLRAVLPDLENAYITVVRCAEKDPSYAGQVALNLAQMLSDLHTCQGKIEEKLRGVVEMMRSTSTFFAPIVLGVTSGLFAMIGARTGSSGTLSSDIELITGIYIGELSFVISFFTVLLMGEKSWRGVALNFAFKTPIAFGVFVMVSIICRTGLTALL